MVRKFLAGAGALALMLPAGFAASGAPAQTDDRFESSPSSGALSTEFTPETLSDDAKIDVIVEMTGDPVALVEAKSGKLSKAEKKQVKGKLERKQGRAAEAIQQRGGTVGTTMQSAYNGMRVTIAGNELSELTEVEGVAAVHPVPEHELMNETSVPFLGAPQVWQDSGYTGENIKVAIIDTGIDYTHANFGGPGSDEAFEAAQSGDPNPDLGWGERVVGGWDFVGDDYTGSSTPPQPDNNPLDCQGHGSHVAGTTGGSGVLPDGSTFNDGYDENTFDTDFKIGPGVAPEADLYALRVFGCGGSTNVTTEAIDWAVEHEMDVINMSLGSSFGTATDSSAVAASNAVASGVVVVASAGNSGPNPYLTGSPGTGDGVVSVAAMDSTASFPGAELTFDGQTINAINANDAELPDGELKITVLEDDPATEGNESLGCHASDYVTNGIVEGGDQVAVTVRGECARVARAAEGQKAGAEAVVMINSETGFPPYEGEITQNPDTGENVTVTIPFLGVRGILGGEPTEDGDLLVAAEGETMTLEAGEIDNPGFRDFASFSSGGPRSGDSGAKPDVAAPGVATFSAEVGSGTEGSYKSGTSMAAPHVAGVAALGIEAHPEWSSDEISSALVTSADADGMQVNKLTRGGAGLIDLPGTVDASVVAFGDEVEAETGQVRTPSLSFGYAESATSFNATKTVTLVNKGAEAATYRVAPQASTQSEDAQVTVSAPEVTVPAGGSATVDVTVSVDASTLPSIVEGSGQHRFLEISGLVEFTGAAGDLAVPYVMVPRPSAEGVVSPKFLNTKPKKGAPVNVENDGAVAVAADFYEWGISDGDDVVDNAGSDVRAAGAQTTTVGGEQALVFAINAHDRYSNAAANQYRVLLDTDQDGSDDWMVFSADSGSVRYGSADGIAEVFMQNLSTSGLYASGFLTVAPTDSSTVLLPVMADSLGVDGAVDYSVATSSRLGYTDVTDSAAFNPDVAALSTTGSYDVLAPGDHVEMKATINQEVVDASGTLGQMVVMLDNAVGASEAQLLPLK